MKVSRTKAAEHRAAILESAGRLFGERGFDGVSVADITRDAGLTHGGFYGHFASKEALAAETCAAAMHACDRLPEPGPNAPGRLRRYLSNYLTERHRDARGAGCPLAALMADVGRGGVPVQAQFASAVAEYAAKLEGALDAPDARARALLMLAAMVGGMEIARATAQSMPDFSGEILHTLQAALSDLTDPTAAAYTRIE